MRQDLGAIWERSTASKEQLLRQLQDWCHRAETSGVASLVDFSRRLRSYAVA
jgi:stearoyl-CoA desaturase (delta-9 desaturase)